MVEGKRGFKLLHLSGLCNKAQAEGSLKGISIARGSPRLNHLLFADDTMFFVRANKESSEALVRVLKLYEEASGQSINTEKSAVTFSHLTPLTLRATVKETLSIQKEGGTGKYLGLPELFGRKKRDLFSSIIDRIQQKAAGWSNRFLSTAGKMTMLKSVLTPIPSFAMTCFQLPVSLCMRIQAALTRFWWDNIDGTNKMAWIAWSKMILPKDQGGLDFRDIQSINDAFLTKLSWRLIRNPTNLLGRTLLGKYCPSGDFLTCPVSSACSHGWRGIMVGRDLIVENSGWAVGNGECLNVWESPWLSLTAQERPMGPAPEALVNLSVADLFLPEKREWNLDLIQQVLPFEEHKIRMLKPSLMGAPDKLMWLLSESGEYTTKTGYAATIPKHTDITLIPQEILDFNWRKSVWNLHTAPKIKLFIWKLFHRALPVGEQLRARQIKVDGKCKLCGLPETIDHLFLHCSFAKRVWALVPVWPSIEFAGTAELRSEWICMLTRQALPPTGIATGSLAPWILWQLWKARNSLVFNDKGFNATEVITLASAAAREWNQSQAQTLTKQKHPPVRASLPEDCVVVRSDAAWNEAKKVAGLGWIIKSQNRASVFSEPARFVGSPLVAEGMALREAVLKCRDLGLPRLRCESDCAQLIKALTSDQSFSELYGIVEDIKSVSFSFDFISFAWISREFNREADELAKKKLSSELVLMATTNFG